MNSLTDTFLRMFEHKDDNSESLRKIYELISDAPDSSERDGLMALLLHEGIGVPTSLEKSFEYAEKAAFEGGDALGYYILGYMCDKAETPDQAEGGPRQKYDHYDAERFYEKCAEKESNWKKYACNWLGNYFLNMARGGDPELGVEYLEQIAEDDAEAAERLSDYYWDIGIPDYPDDERAEDLFRWTKKAVELDEEDEEFLYRLGWLYADGIGCEKSFLLALKYFGLAYFAGDWRGAESIANLIQDKLEEEDTGLTPEEEYEFQADIAKWRQRAASLKAESDAEEPDPSIEED